MIKQVSFGNIVIMMSNWAQSQETLRSWKRIFFSQKPKKISLEPKKTIPKPQIIISERIFLG
ncbi:hypothetical protein [Cloacibacterium sp. Arc16]